MKERIFEQVSKELKVATRLDTKMVITAIVVTLILFSLAMGFAFSTVTPDLGQYSSLLGISSNATFNTTPTIIMFVLLLAIIVIDCYAVRTLANNKKQRAKLNEGLMKLYKDEGVDQYYDGSIFKSYETRYNLLSVMVGAVGALSVIVPLTIFIDQLTKL
ncbi:MAG: hypothetical protein WC370_09665 [Dehalococcoidales bacterium]|jgi:uncharacterized membrane protein YcjF (UPF0283 family)